MREISNTLLKLENIKDIDLLKQSNLDNIVDDILNKIAYTVKRPCDN